MNQRAGLLFELFRAQQAVVGGVEVGTHTAQDMLQFEHGVVHSRVRHADTGLGQGLQEAMYGTWMAGVQWESYIQELVHANLSCV